MDWERNKVMKYAEGRSLTGAGNCVVEVQSIFDRHHFI